MEQNNRNKILPEALWVFKEDAKLRICDKKGNRLNLYIKQGAYSIKPSQSLDELNSLDATLYVNIAENEEDMKRQIAESNF